MRSFVLRRAGWLLLLPLALGCGQKVTIVTGNVTYEGEPVQDGYISFLPSEDGKGEGGGGRIRGGKYRAEVPPGSKRVQIQAGDQSGVRVKGSGEEVGKVTPQMTRPREDIIPPDAEGQNQVVDIGGKTKKLDFELHKPKRETQVQPPGLRQPGQPGQIPGQPPRPGGPGTPGGTGRP